MAMLIAGAVAGVLAGLLGVGGGIVIVPALENLFENFCRNVHVIPSMLCGPASTCRTHPHVWG